MMTVIVGVIMDPIESIDIKKDSTFAMILECQRRGWRVFYLQQGDLYCADGVVSAKMAQLEVKDDEAGWYSLSTPEDLPLVSLDCILMRKDPPFDIDYIYTTQLLDVAEQQGVLVVNKPQSLRDANEKLSTLWFPSCTPPTLVTQQQQRLIDFIEQEADVIVKPLEGMGGRSVFRVKQGDPNRNVILETLTHHETRLVMAQRYIPEITRGDKRILLVDGIPVDYALARVPKSGETRGNLAAGGSAHGVALTERDHEICKTIAPTLREKGLLFVGIDVIGDYLTEINITSPTCIRQLDSLYGLNISGLLMDRIAELLEMRADT